MQNWEQQQPSGSGKHTRMENYVGFVTGLCQEWNKLAFTKSLIVVFATNTTCFYKFESYIGVYLIKDPLK